MELREMQWEDIVDVYELLKIESVSRYTVFPIDSLDDFIDYYETVMMDDLLYVLETDTCICGLIQFHTFKNDSCELGYYMHPKYRRRGWMKQCLLTMFSQIDVSCIYAYIAQDNLASITFAQAMGFQHVNQDEPMCLNDGKNHFINIYERRI